MVLYMPVNVAENTRTKYNDNRFHRRWQVLRRCIILQAVSCELHCQKHVVDLSIHYCDYFCIPQNATPSNKFLIMNITHKFKLIVSCFSQKILRRSSHLPKCRIVSNDRNIYICTIIIIEVMDSKGEIILSYMNVHLSPCTARLSNAWAS